MNELGGVVVRGLEYITTQCLLDGSFVSQSWPKVAGDKKVGRRYRTTFFPSLIGLALQNCQHPKAQAIRQRLAEFLLSQKTEQWSFNYWAKDSKEYQRMPYPDDLDDTFCALALLQKEQPNVLDGKTLATIAHLLISCESRVGGPYKTWLVGQTVSAEWHDVDTAVNANIAYFLSLKSIHLENIQKYIEQAVVGNEFSSPYYPSRAPLIYFISRWYNGTHKERLLKTAMTELQTVREPQDMALLISAACHLGQTPQVLKPFVEKILKSQNSDGSWPMAAFCIDPSQGNKVYVAGASSLATAFIVEALCNYQQSSSAVHVIRGKNIKNVRSVQLNICAIKQPELRKGVRFLYRRILAADSHHLIIDLPKLVAAAYDISPSHMLLKQLGTVNTWGWMAYTGFDDAVDEGDMLCIPASSYCLRQFSLQIQKTLPSNTAFQQQVVSIMERLDSANAWELRHCRFPISNDVIQIRKLPNYGDYWQLADRSIGHTIAAVGVLYDAKIPHSAIDELQKFFRHYLIARQLNDDAHDWEDDLGQGHINAVGVYILAGWLKRHPGRKKLKLSVESDELRSIMWEEVIVVICRQIKEHINHARAAAKHSGAIDKTFFDKLLAPVEKAADQALEKRKETIDFINEL